MLDEQETEVECPELQNFVILHHEAEKDYIWLPRSEKPEDASKTRISLWKEKIELKWKSLSKAKVVFSPSRLVDAYWVKQCPLPTSSVLPLFLYGQYRVLEICSLLSVIPLYLVCSLLLSEVNLSLLTGFTAYLLKDLLPKLLEYPARHWRPYLFLTLIAEIVAAALHILAPHSKTNTIWAVLLILAVIIMVILSGSVGELLDSLGIESPVVLSHFRPEPYKASEADSWISWYKERNADLFSKLKVKRKHGPLIYMEDEKRHQHQLQPLVQSDEENWILSEATLHFSILPGSKNCYGFNWLIALVGVYEHQKLAFEYTVRLPVGVAPTNCLYKSGNRIDKINGCAQCEAMVGHTFQHRPAEPPVTTPTTASKRRITCFVGFILLEIVVPIILHNVIGNSAPHLVLRCLGTAMSGSSIGSNDTFGDWNTTTECYDRRG